jgi:hypothetical protein
MFAAFAVCSVVFSYGPLSRASSTAVTAVLVPLKLALGAATGAAFYPFMADPDPAQVCFAGLATEVEAEAGDRAQGRDQGTHEEEVTPWRP